MRARHLVTVGFGCLAAAGPAVAAEGGDAIAEIVVTAQKRAESAQDIGISVTAFDATQLRERGVGQPQDIPALVPNFYVKNTSGSTAPVFTLRGVGVNDFVTNAPPSVGIYVDEIFTSNSGMMSTALFDIERVEVVKGPQGDLFGRNTTGGFVSFVTRRPTREFEGYVTAELGNYEAAKVEAAISGPLGPTLAGRLAIASRNQFDGWFRNDELGRDWGSIRQLGWRASLAWHPSDAARVSVGVHGGTDRSDNAYYMNIGCKDPAQPTTPARIGPVFDANCAAATIEELRARRCTNYVGYTDADGDPFTGRSNILPRIDTDGYGAVLRIEYDFAAATLVSVTGFDRFDKRSSEDTDASPSRFIEVDYDSRTRQISQEVRLASNADGRMDWIAGVSYGRDTLDTFDTYFYTDRPFRDTNLYVAYEQETESTGAFAHVRWRFAPQWRLVAGTRYTQEKREWVGGTIDGNPLNASFFLPPFVTPGSPFDPTVYCPATPRGTYLDCNLGRSAAEKIDDSDWTWRAGLEYEPADDVLLYATYSTGFKSGAFSGTWSDLAGGHLPSRKEQLKAAEIGLKSLFAARTLQLNVAAFRYDYIDLQGLAFDPVLFKYGVDNIGDADVRGAELDLAWKPLPGLDLRLGYGWLDSELTSPNPVIGNEAQVGNRLPNAPENSVNASATYEWTLGGGARLTATVDARHQSEVFFNIDNSDRTREKAYTLVNARLGFRPVEAPWDVLLWVRNLADEEYFQEAFVTSGGNILGNVGAPRTYGVTATLRF